MTTRPHRARQPAYLPRLTAIAAAAQLLLWLPVQAQTAPTPAVRAPLPVTCAQTACAGFPNAQGVSSTINQFVGQGAGSVTVNGNAMAVNQTSSTALFNWRSFDIARDHTVHFNQTQGRNAVAINRIYDTQVSRIDGNLTATGQVYLINPNGLLFGSGANVNVAGLIASTLDINPNRVQNGLLGRPNTEAAFSVVNNTLAGSAGIDIQNGARIHAGVTRTVDGKEVTQAGSVFVFAPRVNNEGAITVTPGGQVVMAAGERIYLAGSDSATLRGLLVEVGQGGVVTNRGEISTPRGNTTMVGMAVNQAHRVNATSAINENGSIRLLARQVATATAGAEAGGGTPQPGNFLTIRTVGRVDIGAGSSTTVTLDRTDTGVASLGDATAAAARSTIVAEAGQIVVGGSGPVGQTLLQAHGGDVTLQARGGNEAIQPGVNAVINASVSTTQTTLGADNPAATLTIGSDVKIDVSGEREAHVDGARNYVFIDRLTSNDMRDAPLQRDGFLRGQGVHINVARDHAFIDVSNRRAAVAGNQAERNATGGTIALRAEGRVDVAQGANFDISGGTTRTTAASGRTSQLITENGRVVDIANARTDERYVGFADRYTLTLDAPREGIAVSRTFDAPVVTALPAFVDGKAAGTLEINAPRGSFAGAIQGHTSPGPQQRANLPAGGELRLGSITGSQTPFDRQIDYLRPHVLVTNTPADAAFQVPGSQADRLFVIDSNTLRSGGVSRLDVRSDGVVTVAPGAALDAGPGGSIALRGAGVDVNADLAARGGSIDVVQFDRGLIGDVPRLVPEADAGRIRFGRDVRLDASGLYTNDQSAVGALSAPIVRNGGGITITGRDVDVADVASFNVDAGASVSASGVVSGGRAGRLSVVSNPSTIARTLDDPSIGRLNLGEGFAERVRGFGFTAGGSLTLAAPRASLGAEGNASATSFDLGLLDRGFESFTFRGADFLEVTPGTVLAPTPRLYGFRRDEPLPVSGASLAQALVPQTPLLGSQRPTSVTLTATRAGSTVRIGDQALVDAGAGGSVQLGAGQSIVSEGELRARGGSVWLSLASVSLTNENATTARFEQRAIQLADGAHIDVSGASQVQTGADGRRSGAVLDGGQVTIDAELGSFALNPGARITADGTRDAVDLRQGNNLVRTEVASRAGAVSIRAQNGLFVEGEVSGRAGGTAVEGGRLSVRLEGLRDDQRNLGGALNISEELFNTIYREDRVLSVTEQATLLPAAGERFSAPNYAGRAQVRPDLVNSAGFDTVQLGSTNTIAVQADTTLRTAASLTLDTQALRAGPGAAISLDASLLSLGFLARGSTYQPNLDADASGGSGSGSLAARAEHIDLVGGLALQGIGQTALNAQGDVRLRGQGGGALRPSGQLRSEGSLTITAAQLTPASMTDYTIDLGSSPQSRLSIESNGQTPLEPLSAAGGVTLRANQIDIAGRVSAPHGRIAVDAREQVRLQAGAVLSVAGTQSVPLGTVFNGSQWVYANDPNLTQNNLASGGGVNWPDKGIRVDGATVDVDPAARLDVSGGGQIVAQEFVRGPNGSFDWRQNNYTPVVGGEQQRNPYFALIPARGDAPAPFDPLIYSDLTSDAAQGGSNLLRVGQTITLGAGSGIPAGTYTVMPPGYALLPGAYALQPVAGYADLNPGFAVREPAGTVIVAGRLSVGEQTSTQRWSGYRVLTGQQFRRFAEWQETTTTALLANAAATQAAGLATPRTPLDAGVLQVDAEQQLRFSTDSIRATPGQSGSGSTAVTGRGAELALAAPEVAVSDQPTPAQTAPSDVLQLQASELTALNAQRLVLGATLQSNADGSVAIEQRATSVSVGGVQPLQAGEVLLAGSAQVSVAPGASIRATDTTPVTTARVNSSGDGAALLVSTAADLPIWARSGASGQGGDLRVAESATLAGRSIVFDASREQTLAPSTRFDARNVGLSSSRINLGDVPQDAAGLDLTTGLLAQLSQVEQLSLSSGAVFNVYGNATLGELGLGRLSLDSAGFIAATPNANLSLRGGDVVLRNSVGTLPNTSPTNAGTGTLNIAAQASASSSADSTAPQGRIEIAGGAQRWAGFAQTTLTATSVTAADGSVQDNSGQIRFTGAGSVQADGNVTLDAARINAGRGADQGLTANGVLRTAASSPDSADTSLELGARLNLNALRIDHGGRIVLPSGEVRLNATGATAGDDVLLLAGSQLSVAGSTQRFADYTADASAGAANLTSASGSVRMQAGSVLDLSGAGVRGDAGRLQISAIAGELALDGRIATQPGSDARGVSVAVDVGRLPDLGVLAPALNGTGAASEQAYNLDVRVRRGDVQLAAGQTLSAHNMRIAADGSDPTRANDGTLRIDGTLNASGERAGRVELHARQQIALGDTARIDAASTGVNEEGGSVLLSARIRQPVTGAQLDAITIAGSARVNVSSGAGAPGGTMTLRAPWQLAPQAPNLTRQTNDVAIAELPDGYLVGARSEVVEATYVPVLTTTQQDSLSLNASGAASASNPLPTWRAQLQNFMTTGDTGNIRSITDRLGRRNSAVFDLRPGLEVQTLGNITVASQIDFTAGLTANSPTGAGNFTWRYGGSTLATSQPGALTLRAGGNLTLTGGLTDGFRTLTNTGGATPTAINANAQLTPFDAGEDSWRYQLTGGADLSGAAAAAVLPAGSAPLGNLVIQGAGSANAVVRTGTGRIDMAAAGDIELRGTNAAVYTGGQRATDAPPAFANNTVRGFNPNFTTHGGGIRAEAGQDIFFQRSPTQLVNNWLWRAGRTTETTDDDGVASLDFSGSANAPTSWWVNANTFTQGIGALGGGDLSISAGRDVRSVTAAVPTNANLVVGSTSNSVRERNGGDLDVQAGRDIRGGLFYAQRGGLNLRADSIAPQSSSDVVLLAQGNNLSRVQARGALTLASAFNPTLVPTLSLFGSANTVSPMNTVFSTYGLHSELDTRSWADSVSIGGAVNTTRLPNPSTGLSPDITSGTDRKLIEALPSTVRLISFGNDVSVQGERLLWPSSVGQLQVLAHDVVLGGDTADGKLVMGAINPNELPNTFQPQQSAVWRQSQVKDLLEGFFKTNDNALVVGTDWGLNRPQNHGEGTSPLHTSDRTSAAVVARSGNIENLNIQVPKSLDMQAAGDILNTSVSAQNVGDSDITRVHAGGRIGFSGQNNGITITGPGLAEVLAGKDIDLGVSNVGITSRGNLVNSQQLPPEGANLVVASGLGTTAQGFVQRPAYDNVLRQFVRYDAFAASGRDAVDLNRSTLNALGLSEPDRTVLDQALRERDQALEAGSAFETWLNGLSEPKKAALALKLIEQVQATANQRFVTTRNTETFAPGYTLLGDLFPTLAASTEGVRQFVQNNPFKGADNADQLRRDVLQGLPQPLREAIELGLAAPAGSSTEFDRALAALSRDTLDSGARQLNANVQGVAGSALDALRDANRLEPNVTTPFARGLDAQARAFAPQGVAGANGINLVFSQIKTEQSGDIALLAPRGGVLVGLANPPAGAVQKQPFQLGVLSLGGGDISAFVRDNVDVFGSRLFTVAGGDVHLWAGVGNIDAGKGPRDVTVAPPPRLVIDGNTGIVSLDIAASVSGSGIGALVTREDQPPSNIRLIAPNGFIDAGEAGIRADRGTVTLGTNIVVNAGNISAGGGVAGGAVVVAPPAPVPQASSGGAQADKAVEQAQKALAEQTKDAEERAKRERRKRVTGEFLGFGEGP